MNTKFITYGINYARKGGFNEKKSLPFCTKIWGGPSTSRCGFQIELYAKIHIEQWDFLSHFIHFAEFFSTFKGTFKFCNLNIIVHHRYLFCYGSGTVCLSWSPFSVSSIGPWRRCPLKRGNGIYKNIKIKKIFFNLK